MKNNIFGRLMGTERVLPIAASFMLAPVFVYAQDVNQIKQIKSETKVKELSLLQESIGKKTLTTEQLKARSKALGIPFSLQSKGQYLQLNGFDKSGRPMYYVTYNAGTAVGTGADKLNDATGHFNLNGEGMTVHEWDGGGVNLAHQEFGGRATQKDSAPQVNDHATHVGGTMVAAGINAAAKGMAPKAKLNAYDWNQDVAEMTTAAKNDAAILSNHSYGFLSGWVWAASGAQQWHWMGGNEDTEFKLYGKYSNFDQQYDLIAVNAPYYLPVKAAGNPRGDGPEPGAVHLVNIGGRWQSSNVARQKNGGEHGFDTIVHGATAKNPLIVGAAHKIPGGYTKPSDVKMASFSAFGPIDDGRIKPDLTGIGVDVFSTNSSGNTYTTMSGTSMASPNVTGSLLLLQEHYSKTNDKKLMKSATLKALAIATANEAGDAPGPDYKHGWGLLNAYKAATTISLNGKYSLIEEKELKNNAKDTISVTALGKEPLVVTIAWTDPAPVVLPNENILDQDLKTLVNDLDIRVTKDGETFLPWKLDVRNPAAPATKGDNDVDNVEQIVIENPVPGAVYEISITHKGTLKKNVFVSNKLELQDADKQDYSVVVTGINNGVKNDLSLDSININALPKDYTAQTPVSFEIVNHGANAISGAKLKYQLLNKDNGTEVSTGEITLEEIASGKTLSQTINLDLSKSFVNYSIIGTITHDSDEVKFNNKADRAAYGTLVDIREKGNSHKFGFEDDLNKNGWTSEDTDKDGKTWTQRTDNRFAYEGTSFAVNFPNTDKGTNDWLFSNPVKLKANTRYRVIANSKLFRSAVKESVDIFVGDQPESGAMLTKIGETIYPTNDGKYKKSYFEFTSPAEDKAMYFGFNNKVPAGTAAFAVAIDEVVFQHAEGKPEVDFSASATSVNAFTPVEFTSNVITTETQPITKYEWIFEPATVTYQDNTTSASQNPKVIFNKEGQYSVTLKATNKEGEATATKASLITVRNVPVKAVFTTSKTEIYSGESVAFTNSSTGNPSPNEFIWTVTPSDGVEFTSNTSANAKNPVIKFNKEGNFAVTLEAKAPHGSSTQTANIKVTPIYGAVKNLKAAVTETSDNAQVKLTWERPILNDIYKEGFEANGNIPTHITVINGNNDRYTWKITTQHKNSGSYGILSQSWNGKNFDVDDYLVTDKLRKDAEVLNYKVKHAFKERYDVYIVPAPESGVAPTKEEILAGHKIYSFDGSVTGENYFINRNLNIKDYTSKDFFIAFHHRTKKEDNSYLLALDDIIVGYDNTASIAAPQNENTTIATVNDDDKTRLQKGELIAFIDDDTKTSESNVKVEFATAVLPHLLGYEVVKKAGGNVIGTTNLDGVNSLSHTDIVNTNGVYTYEVRGLYSDSVKSEEKTVTVEIVNLSVSDTVAQNDRLKVYPNPSDGNFVIDAGSKVSSLKAEVYDASGKQIFNKAFQSNKANINLTQYPKGVYILNVVDNNDVKQSVKLIIK
ncbi:MAG: S8 family serine peptidase [Bergeyella zoohelcum]|nr:S8 family serine peptidase [Bergeyella zoohelcum]